VSPLKIAIQDKQIEIAKILLEHNAQVDKSIIDLGKHLDIDVVDLQQQVVQQSLQGYNTEFIGTPVYLKKQQRDELFGAKFTVFLPLMKILAPDFTQQVLENESMIESLSTEELSVLQQMIDVLIYSRSNVLSYDRHSLVIIFLLNRVESELAEFNFQAVDSIIQTISLNKAIECVQQIDEYLEREEKWYSQTVGISLLEQLKEYCLDYIGVNGGLTNEHQLPPSMKQYLPDVCQRRSVRPLNIPSASPILPNALSLLFLDYDRREQDADVELQIGVKKVKCHKSVLCSQSLFFETVLNSTYWTLNDPLPEEMIHIVHYCYGFMETSMDHHHWISTMKLAHEHGMNGLVELVSRQIQLTHENFLDVAQSVELLADDPIFRTLMDKLVEFGVKHRKQLFNSETVKLLPHEILREMFLLNC